MLYNPRLAEKKSQLLSSLFGVRIKWEGYVFQHPSYRELIVLQISSPFPCSVKFTTGSSCIYFTIVLSFRQPAQACSTAPESALELKQISHCPSLSNLTQVTMVPLGHLAKGATLEDLLETCIQSFGECLEVFRIVLICFCAGYVLVTY